MRYVHPAEEHKREAAGSSKLQGRRTLKIRRKKSAGLYTFHYIGESELMSIYRNSLETLVDVTGIEPATPCLQRLVARVFNDLAVIRSSWLR